MILSNTALSEALADGRLVIEPEPKPVSGPGSPFGTSAVDLRLGAVLAKPQDAPHAVVDMGRAGASEFQGQQRPTGLPRSQQPASPRAAAC